MDDPKLARKLARMTWIVLVAAFVMLTRFPVDPVSESAALAAVVAIVATLNAPVALGLTKTRAQSASPPWRAIALALFFRVAALVAVLAVVTAH